MGAGLQCLAAVWPHPLVFQLFKRLSMSSATITIRLTFNTTRPCQTSAVTLPFCPDTFTEIKSHRVIQPQMILIIHGRFAKSDSHLGHRLRHFDAAAAGKGVGELLCVGGLQPEVQLLGQVLAQLRQHPPVHTHAATSSLDIYGVSNFACVAGAPKQGNTRRKAAEQNCTSLALPSCSRTAHSDAQSGFR
jgi:hypothetical protein